MNAAQQTVYRGQIVADLMHFWFLCAFMQKIQPFCAILTPCHDLRHEKQGRRMLSGDPPLCLDTLGGVPHELKDHQNKRGLLLTHAKVGGMFCPLHGLGPKKPSMLEKCFSLFPVVTHSFNAPRLGEKVTVNNIQCWTWWPFKFCHSDTSRSR